MENLDFLTPKENEARNKLLEKFSPEKIAEISDEEIAERLYGNNDDSMAHNIGKQELSDFGTIRTDIINKVQPIYMKKGDINWYKNANSIPFEEVKIIAIKTKDSIKQIDILIKLHKFNDLFVFLNENKEFFKFSCLHKYLCIIYPNLFLHWHKEEKFKKYKKILNLKDNKNIFVVEKHYWDEYKDKIEELNMKEKTDELEKLIIEKDKGDSMKKTIEDIMQNKKFNNKKQPLNQILYGPPGTGKTYNTVIKAMEIITFEEIFKNWYLMCREKDVQDKDKIIKEYISHIYKINEELLKTDNIFSYHDKNIFLKLKDYILNSKYITGDKTRSNPNSYYRHCLIRYEEFLEWLTYDKIKEEFDKLKQSGQIEFITFHQSYSYEEFIEGIKPNLENKDLNYRLEDGILKKLANKASKFEHIFNVFKEEYPDWTELKTNVDNSIFYIKYNNKSIEIYKDKENLITTINNEVLKNYFYLDFKYKFKTQTDLQNKLNTNSGLSYHFAILIELRKYIKPHIIIIDEINRGNISKIFGEMITLIEEDKRIGNEHELKLTLPYSKEKESFGIPNNLYIIGTMNTSDRSIASVDIALRRRFKFIEMMPQSKLVANIFIKEDKYFQDIFKALNEKIIILLDKDHQIGHSYFIEDKFKSEDGTELDDKNKIEILKNIWFDEILPLLNEYFYNDWEKLQALLGEAELKKDKESQENNSSFIVKSDLSKYKMKDIEKEDKVIFDFVDKDKINFEEALLKIDEETKQDSTENTNKQENA